jgi:hypothetical protein
LDLPLISWPHEDPIVPYCIRHSTMLIPSVFTHYSQWFKLFMHSTCVFDSDDPCFFHLFSSLYPLLYDHG